MPQLAEAQRPAYFVITAERGHDVPAIYWDELPQRPIRHLVYILRLDQYPNGAEMAAAPLSDLLATYQWLKAHGKLPPRWEPPRPKVEDRPTGCSAGMSVGVLT